MNKLKTVILLATLAITMAANAQSYTRRSNLPAVFIRTFDGYAINSKTVEKLAKMIVVDEEDNVTVYDSIYVRGRGNSTWNMRKKPYRIKFLAKEKFLGKGYANAKKWTLLANAGDKTLIRNAVTASMGKFLGLKFNPAFKFVDLNINDTDMGNYQISDQIEVKKHRVDVEEQDFPLTDESDITGGYLLEVDGFNDGNCFTTSRYSVPVRIHYPEEEEIVPEQNDYIRKYIRNFETVLSSSDFADPEKGYRRWVDSVSLANWFIATEVSANIDGYYSTYFYKDRADSLLYWGPLWDYDVAYGNDTRKGDTSRQMMTDVGYGQTRMWVNRMWEDPWFGKLINNRYREALSDGLVNHMMETIDSLTTLLQASQELNYNKWGISTKMYNERVLYSSYDQYVSDLKQFINTHTQYLTTAFANKRVAEPTPPFTANANYYYRIVNVGNSKAIDITNNEAICIWDNLSNRESEQWEIIPVGNNTFQIINRNSNLALNDPTEGLCTATTNVGTQLNVAQPDNSDKRQLWYIVPQGSNGAYNLTNVHTAHTANLSGGGSTNGTAVLSYTNDSRNSESNNRKWYIIQDEAKTIIPEEPEEPIVEPEEPEEPIVEPEEPEEPIVEPTEPEEPEEPIVEPEDPEKVDIAAIEPEEYALAFNPVTRQLHFGSATPEQLTFMVRIHNASGKLIGQFRASESFSTANIPDGVYIISWLCGGKQRSVKTMLK